MNIRGLIKTLRESKDIPVVTDTLIELLIIVQRQDDDITLLKEKVRILEKLVNSDNLNDVQRIQR